MNPEISVVVPAHNATEWIGATLESVANQTLPRESVEVIVVDDCSSDDTVAVARSRFADLGMSARVVELPRNRGVSAARNVGWRSASGEWIQFLDADDLLASDKLQLQREFAMLSPNCDVVYSPWQHITLNGSEWLPSGPVHSPFVDERPVVQILQDPSFGYLGPTLIRRRMLEAVGGFDELLSIGEDLDLMLRIARKDGQFRRALSATPTFYYRQTPNSLWRASVARPDQMQRLYSKLRAVELFLRSQSPGGVPDDAEADALVAYYAKLSEFVDDPDQLCEIGAWISGLGRTYSPPRLNGGMRLMSRCIGWEKAIRMRAFYRKRTQGLLSSAS